MGSGIGRQNNGVVGKGLSSLGQEGESCGGVKGLIGMSRVDDPYFFGWWLQRPGGYGQGGRFLFWGRFGFAVCKGSRVMVWTR